MTHEMYNIGKRLNEQTKRSVLYHIDQVENLMCAMFCDELLHNDKYILVPEQVTALNNIIKKLEK